VAGAAHDRGKHRAGRIITGEAGLNHPGTIVNNKRSDLVFPASGKHTT